MPNTVKIFTLPITLPDNSTQYWWTLYEAPPYRRGKKGWDWGGPFYDEDDAVKAAMEAYEGRGLALVFEHLEGFKLSGNISTEEFILKFFVPLDEFSERLLSQRQARPDQRAFLLETKIDIDVSSAAAYQYPKIWVLNSILNRGQMTVKPANDSWVLIMTSFRLVYCYWEPPSHKDLVRMLVPNISLGDLYPEIRNPEIIAP